MLLHFKNQSRINNTKLFLFIPIIYALLFTGCAVTPAKPITSIKINLPEKTNWIQITNKSDNKQYTQEWVPRGQTGLNTHWIIVKQKFIQQAPISAEKFLHGIYYISKRSCVDTHLMRPYKINTDGHETIVGRIMCSQQIGKNYGTFTDQRVITYGTDVYTITSELRVPASKKAGTIEFSKKQSAELKRFIQQQSESAIFVRKAIELCNINTEVCTNK